MKSTLIKIINFFFNEPNFPAVLEVREWLLCGERLVMAGRGMREPAGEGSVLDPRGGWLQSSTSSTPKLHALRR